MKKLIKVLVISFASLMCSNQMMIRAAALEEGWEQIRIEQEDVLFIQNESIFPLVITYLPPESANVVDTFLPAGTGAYKNVFFPIAQPQRIKGPILIRVGKREIETARQFLSGIPGLTAITTIGGQFAKTVVPYYTTFEALLGGVTKIIQQTVPIDPKSYAPGTILLYYWPLGLAALNYPPIIIPLANRQAIVAWMAAQDTLDYALKTGIQGATTAYRVIQDFATGQKALNSDQIGNIETIVKQKLPAVQPAPRTEGIIEEYEPQPQ